MLELGIELFALLDRKLPFFDKIVHELIGALATIGQCTHTREKNIFEPITNICHERHHPSFPVITCIPCAY